MRVISMVPSWTETLIHCGVDVVGRTRFCIHPENKVKSISAVGGTKNLDWNKIKELDPQVLILDEEENPIWMADQSQYPYYASHVQSIQDMPRELSNLAHVLLNKELEKLAMRWSAILQNPPQVKSVLELPGIIEWIQKPDFEPKKIVYVIWKNPWIAVSQDTFIGSMLEFLGQKNKLISFAKKYPEFKLEDLDPKETLLLFSSEPFPFAKQKEEIKNLGFASAIIDGEAYSWFGVRSLGFLESLY